mgnify:FL=1
MSGLRSWAVLVCTAAVVCTLLYRLFPETSLGRQGRLLLPCVFRCVLLTPLLRWQPALPELSGETAAADSEALTAAMQQQTRTQVETVLCRMVNQALASYDLEVKKVKCSMDIDGDSRINMGQITLYVDARNAVRSLQIQQIAEKRLGAPVTVAAWEGDDAWGG